MGCGMLVAGGREYLFPITEIVSKKDFFDYEAKYTAGYSDEITPADITPEVEGRTAPHDPRARTRHLPLFGRRTGRLHRHARRRALFDRAQLHSRHEQREASFPSRPAPWACRWERLYRPHHRRHLPQMIEIDDKIVSADLLRECFACDIAQCKGHLLRRRQRRGAARSGRGRRSSNANTAAYKPYMTPEGIEAVERQGFMVVDEDGDLTTPLVGRRRVRLYLHGERRHALRHRKSVGRKAKPRSASRFRATSIRSA